MTGCGTNGGMVHGGENGKISVRRLLDLMDRQLYPHGRGIASIVSSKETTTTFGINGGMVPGGGNGKTSVLQEVACRVLLQLYPGGRIELIVLSGEEMMSCGISGGTERVGVSGKIWDHQEADLMEPQVFPPGHETGWIVLCVEIIINSGISGGTGDDGGTGRTLAHQEGAYDLRQLLYHGEGTALTASSVGRMTICGTNGIHKLNKNLRNIPQVFNRLFIRSRSLLGAIPIGAVTHFFFNRQAFFWCFIVRFRCVHL